jgi:hypothetical protein
MNTHVWEFETCGCRDCVARRAARQERDKLEREGLDSFESRSDEEDGVVIRGPRS